MHLTVLRFLPWSIVGHCIFSMWAYGSPEIWPDGFHAAGANSNGQTIYSPDDRNFGQRLFNKNSITFFILIILFIIGYIFENIIQGWVFMFIFKSYATVDVNQPTFKECKDKMSEWTVISYQPSENLKYDKILMAMLDVAEINEDIEDSEEKKMDKKSQVDSQNELLDERNSRELPPINSPEKNREINFSKEDEED